MPGLEHRPGVGQHREAGAEALRHLLQRPQPQPGAGEFQGQWDPVEAPADLGRERGPFGVLEGGRGLRGRGHGVGAEEGEGVAVGSFAGQRADLDDLLAGAAERFPGGDQHRQSGCGLEEFAHEMAALGDHVLAGVEDEEQLLVGHPRAQLLVEGAGGVVGQADGVGDGHGEQAGVAQRRELHPPDPVGPGLFGVAGGPQGEPGLADAAHPGEGGQPAGAQQAVQGGEFVLPADEARRVGRQVPRQGAASRLGIAVGLCGIRLFSVERVLTEHGCIVRDLLVR